MILNQIVFSLLLTLVTAFSVQAMELGPIALGGNGCYGTSQLIETTEGRLLLPLRVRVNKKADTAFDRKTCNIRIPISLAANEKLQILDVSHRLRVFAYQGAEVKASLNISLVGQKTSDLVFAVKAVDKNISLVKIVKSDAAKVLAESKCGQDTMLAGNLNVLVTGQAGALISTGSTQVTLRVVSCDN